MLKPVLYMLEMLDLYKRKLFDILYFYCLKVTERIQFVDWLISSWCVCQIMDEADRLLEQGCTDFTKDLETIMSILPATRQTLLFSATLTDTLQELKNIAMNKPFFWESKSEWVTCAVYSLFTEIFSKSTVREKKDDLFCVLIFAEEYSGYL